MRKLTKKEVITKIKAHISGCRASKRLYIRQEEWNAAQDMKSRIDGLQIALDYVKQMSNTQTIKK